MKENKLFIILGALIIPFAIFMIARGLLRRGTVALGDRCTIGSVDECVQGGECLTMDGHGVCTTQCATTADCPSGMVCELIQVSVSGAPGVAMNRDYEAQYCVP